MMVWKARMAFVFFLLSFIAAATYAGTPPLFELKTLDGDQYKLEDDLGKSMIILDFWATWCKPCVRELPHINKIYETYKDSGLKVYAISTDNASSKSKIRPTMKRHKLTIPVLLDPSNEVIRKYNPTKTIPYLVVIGKNGETIREFSGYKPGDEKIVEELVAKELASAQTEQQK